MDDEWVIVGGGPSAEKYRHLCKGRKVACVNASEGMGDLNIDAYGVFENEAFPLFAERWQRMKDNGVECITRRTIDQEHDAGGRILGQQTGYDQTAVAYSDAFCSSGVAMMNAVATFYKPKVIHVIGFDGYGDDRDKAISTHIEKITKAHRGVEFVMYGFSRIPRQNRWRMRRVEAGI